MYFLILFPREMMRRDGLMCIIMNSWYSWVVEVLSMKDVIQKFGKRLKLRRNFSSR
jgi:hypothetical protein